MPELPAGEKYFQYLHMGVDIFVLYGISNIFITKFQNDVTQAQKFK